MFGFKRRKVQRERVEPTVGIEMRDFYSTDVDRLLTGWTTGTASIDQYLSRDLKSLRARSRELSRKNPYGKHYTRTMRKNILGNAGVQVQCHSKFSDGRLDERANAAIEAAWKDWSKHHADWSEMHTFLSLKRQSINTVTQDGEFIFRKHYGKSAGKYGFQIEVIDPELLDTEKNEKTRNGEIRLGVEYNSKKKVVRYWFREKDENGNYYMGRSYSIEAKYIIHGFLPEYPDQSRGIPWLHSALESAKHLEKYEESAMVAARKGAALAGFVKSNDPNDAYAGEEEGTGAYEGATIASLENGQYINIGNNDVIQVDPAYPHQMYSQFTNQRLSRIAAGGGVSYESLSGDLKGATYSSMRMGALDEREHYKELQDWLIQCFVEPVFMEWLSMAYLMGAITIGNRPLSKPLSSYQDVHFQPRRWDWVDPVKEGNANTAAIKDNLKSRSQIIRESGNDPDTVWREIQREKELFAEMGIQVVDDLMVTAEADED